MKTHSTNYTNTFISVPEDCPVSKAEVPPQKREEKSIANLQFDMIYPLESKEYKQLSSDKNVTQTKAMRSNKK